MGEKARNTNVRSIRAFEIQIRPASYIKRKNVIVIMIITILSHQFREPQSRLDPLAAAIYSSHSPRIRCGLTPNAATPSTTSYDRISCPSIGRMTSLWQRTEKDMCGGVVVMPKIKQSTTIVNTTDIGVIPIAAKQGVTERWEIFSFMIVELHRTVSWKVVLDRVDFSCKYAGHGRLCKVLAHKETTVVGIG